MPGAEPHDDAREERRDTRILLAFAATVLAAGAALGAACAWNRYPAGPAARGPLVVRGGPVFDGSGGVPAPEALVVIQDDRIACVGPACRVPEGARTIDAHGLAVLPGLVDLEIHFGSPVEEDRGRPIPLVMLDYARLRPRDRQRLLDAGVTTIRDLGNAEGTSLALKRGVASGRLGGPRVYAVGPIFTAPMGIPAATDLGGNLWVIEHVTRQVTDPEDARREVRRLAGEGFEGVASVYDTGVADRLPRLALPVLRAIIDEAHVRGLWAAVSTGHVQEVRDAAEAGADTIQLGAIYDGPLGADIVELLRARGVTYVPAFAAVEAFVHSVERGTRPETFPAASWEAFGRLVREQGPAAPLAPLRETVRRAAAAGVRIGAGTTGGTGFGTSLHRELELLVESGLSPSDALLAATRNAAVALRAENDLGRIAPGKIADLVLVDGHPWEDIARVRNVQLVIQAGRVVVDRRQPGGAP